MKGKPLGMAVLLAPIALLASAGFGESEGDMTVGVEDVARGGKASSDVRRSLDGWWAYARRMAAPLAGKEG